MAFAERNGYAIIDTLYRAHHGWLTAWLRKKMACPHNAAGGRKNMPEKQPAMLLRNYQRNGAFAMRPASYLIKTGLPYKTIQYCIGRFAKC
jgi:hypothetical protein